MSETIIVDQKTNNQLRRCTKDDVVNASYLDHKQGDQFFTVYMPDTAWETFRPLKILKVTPTGVKGASYLKSKNKWVERSSTIKFHQIFIKINQ